MNCKQECLYIQNKKIIYRLNINADKRERNWNLNKGNQQTEKEGRIIYRKSMGKRNNRRGTKENQEGENRTEWCPEVTFWWVA